MKISPIPAGTASRREQPAGDFRVDGFHHDNGIVDDQPNRRRDASQGHEIKAQPCRFHGDQGDQDRHGNDDDGRQRRSPILEEEENDQRLTG